MIYVLINKDGVITGAIDTKHIVGFVYDGTSPDYEHRYILKLTWGHTLTVGALDMQHILSAMENEANNAERREE
jgi:hypothetical protein